MSYVTFRNTSCRTSWISKIHFSICTYFQDFPWPFANDEKIPKYSRQKHWSFVIRAVYEVSLGKHLLTLQVFCKLLLQSSKDLLEKLFKLITPCHFNLETHRLWYKNSVRYCADLQIYLPDWSKNTESAE